MKLEMLVRSVVREDGSTQFVGDRIKIPYPMKFFVAKNDGINSYRWTPKTATGKYHGPSNNFGGIKSGDIILMNNPEDPFYTYVTYWTQDWTSSWAEYKLLFFKNEYWNLIKEAFDYGFQKGDISEDFYRIEIMKIFGVVEGSKIYSDSWMKKFSKSL